MSLIVYAWHTDEVISEHRVISDARFDFQLVTGAANVFVLCD